MSIAEGSIAEVWQRGGVEVRRSTEDERSEYLRELQSVSEVLDETVGKGSWVVIGGIARVAILKEREFVVKGPGGDWRDLDILVLDEKKNLSEFKKQYHGFMEVGGTMIQSSLRFGEDDVELRFGKVVERVSKRLFRVDERRVGDVTVPVLPINTLLHLFAVGDRPGGKMREKDFYSALDLARAAKKEPDEGITEADYAGFHRFAKSRVSTTFSGFAPFLRKVGIFYRNSPLNKIMPINHGEVKEVILHLYKLVGDVDIGS